MKLQDFLKQSNVKRRDFAVQIGVSPNSVSRYVTGTRVPARKEMARIVEATAGAVVPNDFFGFSPEVQTEQDQ